MTFYERVNGLCKQRGISITALIQTLGFSKSAATTWKNSENWPRNSTMKTIADHFEMSVDELTEGVDEPIDWANIDTSGFNQPVWRNFLSQYGDEKQAIRAYVNFEKQLDRDRANDPDRHAVFQNHGGVVGVQGTAHAPVTIHNGTEQERQLTEQELEILRLFAELDTVQRAKVLIYAGDIKEGK